MKEMLLKSLLNLLENTCNGLQHKDFLLNFAEVLRTTILKNICKLLSLA